ncbi:hypothetical protein [Nocardia paucivorans]|uniref:hypothetical protein n=1 Tax=Nocardia paucivorans TaxID=114259 RepID=UPI000592E097|nr:hypothetical protein [Nocardia paucivorans]
MSDQSAPTTTAEVVEAWEVPPGALAATRIRDNILQAVRHGYDDPQLIADLAVGPLVMAVGQLEVALADARRRITELEAELGRRFAGPSGLGDTANNRG